MRFKSFAALLLLADIASAHAAPGSECHAKSDQMARLECYDPGVTDYQAHPVDADVAVDEVRSLIDQRISAERSQKDNWFSITAHRPIYVLPVTVNTSSDFSRYQELGPLLNDTEVKFQISLKTELVSGLWRNSFVSAAYSQQSFWQLYADEGASSPFRETNHEPELMWTIPVDFELAGWEARLATLAFNHQSNGRSNPLSRSWNRITGNVVFERNRFVISAKTWKRLGGEKNDDNPFIEDYMGRVELSVGYGFDDQFFAINYKNGLAHEKRSGVELSWTFPLTGRLKGFAQFYSGYGENLIDMEQYTNRFGIGISLNDYL